MAAWATDVGAGGDATMLALRRANVAALDARARTVMADTGRLAGAELDVDLGWWLMGPPNLDPREGCRLRGGHSCGDGASREPFV